MTTCGNSIGQIVASYRKVYGQTQEELALMLGIPRSYLAMIETGAREPSLKVLTELRLRYGLSVDAIIDSLAETRKS